MALMQKFPRFEAFRGKLGGDRVVTKSPGAVDLVFRSGGDLNRVVNEIGVGKYLLRAAPGSGKTTLFPAALAKIKKALVIHTFPFEHLAYCAWKHVSSKPQGMPVVYWSGMQQELPETGLVFTTAACVVARWLAEGDLKLPLCYLLQDESHESGPASAGLRDFGHRVEGVVAFIQMSATADLDEVRPMEAGGVVTKAAYDPDAFADPWAIDEEGAPWCAEELDGSMVLFEDSDDRAEQLVQAYNVAGFHAYRFTGTSSGKLVWEAFQPEPYGFRYKVFVLDSSFRSGHTIDASRVIDSGCVERYAVSDDGHIVKHRRHMYAFESEQAAARCGRVSGSVAQYHSPFFKPKRVMCDLAQSDAEAYALICRFLGYRPPRAVRDAKMAVAELIPKDLCDALNREMPLVTYPASLCVPVEDDLRNIREAAVQVPASLRLHEVRSDSRQVESRGLVIEPEAAVKVDDKKPRVGLMESLASSFSALLAPLDGAQESDFEYGDYAYVDGICTHQCEDPGFPEGHLSVLRQLGRKRPDVVVLAWDDYRAAVALNLVVRAYNGKILELRAIARALRHIKKTGSELGKVQREWLSRTAERASELSSETAAHAEVMWLLAHERCQLRVCEDGFKDMEKQMGKSVSSMYAELAFKPRLSSRKQVQEDLRAVAGRAIEGVPEPPKSQLPMVESNQDPFTVPAIQDNMAYNYSGRMGVAAASISVAKFTPVVYAPWTYCTDPRCSFGRGRCQGHR